MSRLHVAGKSTTMIDKRLWTSLFPLAVMIQMRWAVHAVAAALFVSTRGAVSTESNRALSVRQS